MRIQTSGILNVTGGNISGYYGVLNGTDGGSSTGRVVVSGTTTEINGTYGIYNYSSASGTDNYAVEVNGGTVIGGTDGNYYGIANYSDGAVVVNGGTISGRTAIRNGNNEATNTGTVTINQVNDGIPTLLSGGINNRSISENAVLINGGQITKASGTAVYNYSTGIITMTGGEIIGDSTSSMANTNGWAIYCYSSGSIVISGGVLTSAIGIQADNGSISISGSAEINATSSTAVTSNYGEITISGGTITGELYGTSTTSGTIDINDGIIKSESGTEGAGVYIFGSGQLNVTGGQIRGYNGIQNGRDDGSSTGSVVVSGTAEISGRLCAIYNNSTLSSETQSAVNILDGTIGDTTDTDYGIYNSSIGKISMSGGTVQASTVGNGIYNYGNGTVDITGGRVYGYHAIRNGDSSSSTGTVSIDQTSTSTPTIIGSDGALYGILSEGNLDISGGSINGKIGIGILSSNSEYTISGGIITATECGISVSSPSATYNISGNTMIQGGTYGIDGIYGYLNLSGTPTINSIRTSITGINNIHIRIVGDFEPINSIELFANSYTLDRYAVSYTDASYTAGWASDFHLANSSYALTLYNDVYLRITNATISNSTKGIGYTDLQGAIDGADPNDVITLLADLTDDTVYEIDKNITIRGENYTSSASANPVTISGAFNVTSGTLTLGADTLSVSGNGYGLLTVENYVQLDGGNLIVNDYTEITGGSVTIDSSSYSVGIYNSGSGTIEITSGSISGGDYGIYNASTSAESITLNADESANDYSISGGTYDIYNFATGRIVIDGHIPPDDQITIYLNNITNTVGDARIHFGSNVSGGANDNMGQIRVFFYGWDLAGTDRIVFSSDVSGLLDGASYIEYLWVGDDTAAAGWTNGEADILHTDGKYYYRWAGCFDENTWIYYWDEKKKKIRRKRAKNVKFKDKLLVWNFDKGCFDFANPLFIQRTEVADEYTEIKFSDGTKLNIVGDHAVYNADCRYFCPIVSNEAYGSPVGTKVMKYDGSIVTIVSKKTIHKKIAYTNIINKYHMNCFTNGILTSTPFNNMYKIDENMKYIPDESKKCHMLSLLDGIDKEIIEGLRLMEFPDRVLLNSPMKSGCKSFKEYIDKKLGVQKESD
mgnify:CR=1 FL=1